MSPWFATAFITGLMSSLHCVGMCGPLVAALPIGRLPKRQRLRAVVLYHTGRMLTYGLLGSLAGTLSLGLYLLGWQKPLSILFGVLLLIRLATRKKSINLIRWPWLDQQVSRTFRRFAQQPSWIGFSALGISNGLLPCGFTYLALAGTLATHTPFEGFSYMFLFGLGTLPALLGVNVVTTWIPAGRNGFRHLFPIMTIVAAILLIERSLVDYKLPAQPADLIPLCYGLLTK